MRRKNYAEKIHFFAENVLLQIFPGVAVAKPFGTFVQLFSRNRPTPTFLSKSINIMAACRENGVFCERATAY